MTQQLLERTVSESALSDIGHAGRGATSTAAWERQQPFAMVRIAEARVPQAISDVADLIRAFVKWQDGRHASHRKQLDAYFDPQAFEADLARLPEPFERPHGRILLATVDGVPAGCIALKPLGEGRCEMKRLYVRPDCHGLGIGRGLAVRLIEEATIMGYSAMRLETGPLQHEAQGLYAALGFHRIPPYRNLPDCLRDWLVCMERPLGPTTAGSVLPKTPLAASA